MAEQRTRANNGFGAYIGSQQVAWSLDEAEAIQAAVPTSW